MLNKKLIDIIYGSVAFLFSLFCLAYLIPVHVKVNAAYAVGPKTFPQMSALLIGFAGLALVATRLSEFPDKRAIFRKVNYSFNWKYLLRQIVFIVAMVAYIKLIPILGFVIASILFVLGMLYFFGSRSLAVNLLVSVVFSMIVYLLFSRLFQVNLPFGLLHF